MDVEIIVVVSRLPAWPRVGMFFRITPVPTDAHFEEVLRMNPALRGWGEPL